MANRWLMARRPCWHAACVTRLMISLYYCSALSSLCVAWLKSENTLSHWEGKSPAVEKEGNKTTTAKNSQITQSGLFYNSRSSEIHPPVSLNPRLGLRSACLVMQRMQYLCRCASQFQAKVAHVLLISSLTRHVFFFFFSRFSCECWLVRWNTRVVRLSSTVQLIKKVGVDALKPVFFLKIHLFI